MFFHLSDAQQNLGMCSMRPLPIARRSVVAILVFPLSTVSKMKKRHERTHIYTKVLGCSIALLKCVFFLLCLTSYQREVYGLDRISHSGFDRFPDGPCQPSGRCMYCYPAILCHLKLHS